MVKQILCVKASIQHQGVCQSDLIEFILNIKRTLTSLLISNANSDLSDTRRYDLCCIYGTVPQQCASNQPSAVDVNVWLTNGG